MLKTNCCWNRWQSWYKKFEVVHCTSCWLPIVGQLWSFTDFPFKWISVFSSKAYEAIEPLAFHRVIALLRTDRNHEEKLVRPRLFALSQSRLRTFIGSLDLFRKVSVFIWALILSRSALCILSPNSTLLCCHNLLVVRFFQVFVPQNRARKDFAHEVHLFG